AQPKCASFSAIALNATAPRGSRTFRTASVEAKENWRCRPAHETSGRSSLTRPKHSMSSRKMDRQKSRPCRCFESGKGYSTNGLRARTKFRCPWKPTVTSEHLPAVFVRQLRRANRYIRRTHGCCSPCPTFKRCGISCAQSGRSADGDGRGQKKGIRLRC